MFTGCQFSLYPMTDSFVDVILPVVEVLKKHQPLRIETDDISTLVVGAPEIMFAALRDCFVAAARRPGHLVFNATFSRGCPGEPDNPICCVPTLDGTAASPDQSRGRRIERLGIPTVAQIALYPMGDPGYMGAIASCIGFVKEAKVFDRSKNFCTRIEGDAADVFHALERSFLEFGRPEQHVVLTVIVSKGSPTRINPAFSQDKGPAHGL